MDGLSPLEALLPEVQSLIMCHVRSAATLQSLIHASPRFYEVFRSRRDYHLTTLAVQHSLAPANVWNTIRASKLPILESQERLQTFINTFQDDEGYNAPVLPTEVAIQMIRFNDCLEWFIPDFAHENLSILSRLGDLMGLQQDAGLVHSRLSQTEQKRIARALCRFQMFQHLFPPVNRTRPTLNQELRLGADFLEKYDEDEIEEIACIRDYLSRRVEGIFNLIEDDFIEGRLSEMIQRAPQPSNNWTKDRYWFGVCGNLASNSYRDTLISLGFPFLKELFTADYVRRAELVLEERSVMSGDLERTFSLLYRPMIQDRRSNSICWPRSLASYQDSVEEPSIGWHWALYNGGCGQPGYHRYKGIRDWGYVFWDKRRMMAALPIDSLEVFHKAQDHWYWEDHRHINPSALVRLRNPQIPRIPRTFKYEPNRDTPEEEIDNPFVFLGLYSL